MAVSIQIKGIDLVKKRMNSIIGQLKNAPDGMTKIGMLGVRDVVDHFNQSQGPTNKWLSLKHRDGKPLLDTGLLRSATRFKVGNNNVLLFNNIKYGKYHQYGASKRFIPQRKWMWISEQARKKMVRTYVKSILGGKI